MTTARVPGLPLGEAQAAQLVKIQLTNFSFGGIKRDKVHLVAESGAARRAKKQTPRRAKVS